MRTLYCSIFLLLTTCISTCCAEKAVTQDPNAGGAAAEATIQVTDARLAQKVNYQSGYKRLHYVTDELTSSTGVTVFSGDSSKNWQVRDIPLVVCVQDMPLGKLLNTIADATHTALTSSKPEGEKDRYYRIYRTRTVQQKIDDFFAQKQKAHQMLAEWNWDVLTMLKDTPYAELKGSRNVLKEMRLLSSALAGLGPDAKDRFMAGECLQIPGDNPLSAEIIRLVDRQDWEMKPKEQKSQAYEELTDDNLAKCTYGIKLLIQNDNPGFVSIERQMHIDRSDGTRRSWHDSTATSAISNMVSEIVLRSNEWARRSSDREARAAAASSNGSTPPQPEITVLPDRPKLDDMKLLDDTPPNLNYRKVSRYDQNIPAVMQAKVRIELPDGVTDPCWADIVQAIAKASGYNIIAEDFYSHRYGIRDSLRALIGTETTLMEALSALNCTWMLDEKAKVLVGWDWSWQATHMRMLPESQLKDLQTKLNGRGVELEDLVPIMGLSFSQASTWIRDNKSLNPLTADQFVDPDYGPLWMLYSLLDDTHRAQTHSDTGLQFAGIDQQWLLNTLTMMRKHYSEQYRKFGDDTGTKLSAALADPTTLRTLTMQVKKIPQKRRCEVKVKDGYVQGHHFKDAPEGDIRHTYTIELTGEKDGAPVTLKTDPLYFAFPIYSPEREKEILRQK